MTEKALTPRPPLPQAGEGVNALPPSPACGRGRVGEGEGKPAWKPKNTTRARELRTNITEAEKLLWSKLRNRRMGGAKFRRQHPFGPYVLDFVCIERNLVIELDGGQHADEAQAAHDRRRTRYLEGEGFLVLRFWNNQVLENIEGVWDTIATALAPRSPLAGEGEEPTNG